MKCLAEWGLSLFVECRAGFILFDLGYSDLYGLNAAQLEVDLQKTDIVVLSHHHSDHTGGLRFSPFKSPKPLILHPRVMEKLPKEELEKAGTSYKVTPSKTPIEVLSGVYFLGEIPRINSFEKGIHKDDPMLDDSALVISTNHGAVVISGCGHAGICNICEYAKSVTGQSLYAVVGGFHLVSEEEGVIQRTISYFESENPSHLFPMHCTGFHALSVFHRRLGIAKIGTGDRIEIEE
jgi:7,8-dihydropterin-6-yl-methyl-4-(beta-D-ribofuranosyl)aminobenzene 5'-phosphate synthase